MFTAFDVFQLFFPLVGLVWGLSLGQKHFGWIGALVGAVLGLVLGTVAGRLPLLIALKWANFGGKSVAQLRQHFQNDEYYIFHLALTELLERGEDISAEKVAVLDLLATDDSDRRKFGWTCLQIAFPGLAEQIAGFDPEEPTNAHIEQIQRFRAENAES